MTPLKDYRDHLQSSTDNVFAVRCIDDFIKQLFLELTGNLEWDFDRNIEFEDELEWWSDESYCNSTFDETIIPDNDMDICVRVKFAVDASQNCDTDGGKFFENVSADTPYNIVFDIFGQEWDLSEDADAQKFANKVIDTWI